jgi:hypothetical protein
MNNLNILVIRYEQVMPALCGDADNSRDPHRATVTHISAEAFIKLSAPLELLRDKDAGIVEFPPQFDGAERDNCLRALGAMKKISPLPLIALFNNRPVPTNLRAPLEDRGISLVTDSFDLMDTFGTNGPFTVLSRTDLISGNHDGPLNTRKFPTLTLEIGRNRSRLMGLGDEPVYMTGQKLLLLKEFATGGLHTTEQLMSVIAGATVSTRHRPERSPRNETPTKKSRPKDPLKNLLTVQLHNLGEIFRREIGFDPFFRMRGKLSVGTIWVGPPLKLEYVDEVPSPAPRQTREPAKMAYAS